MQSAIEEFAQQLALVIRRFLRLKDWRDTECLVIGGGFSGSRIGELAVGRAGLLLKADKIDIDLELIRSDPDEAGLLGAAHLLPAWMLKGYEGILAVDVGGTNIRAGVVELNLKKATDLSKAQRGPVRAVAARATKRSSATTPSSIWQTCSTACWPGARRTSSPWRR